MNQFFFETRGKEKVKELLDEGQRSQAFYRSGSPRLSILRGLPKMLLLLATILGILAWMIR